MSRRQRKQAKRVAVCVYECNRAYGGPEEGGWWFDYGTLVEVVSVHFSRERAYAAAGRLHHWCEADNLAQQRRPIHSVLCDGVLEAYVQPFPPPQHFPDRTPRYE